MLCQDTCGPYVAQELMRIVMTLHCTMDLNSGAPGVTLELRRALERQGHAVTILSFDDLPARMSLRARYLVFPVWVAARLVKLSRRSQIDVVDASTGDAWLWSDLARRVAPRTALVTRAHGLEHKQHQAIVEEARRRGESLGWKYPLWRGGPALGLVRRSLRMSDLCLFLNEEDAEFAVRRLGVSPGCAALTANGLTSDLLGLTHPEPAGGTRRIAQIGSYLPTKGTESGRLALAAVLHRHESVSVSFLGVGCAPARVYADFDPVLHPRIAVHSRFERVALPQHLAGHHIKFFPTLREGFSGALIEAMACGLAPVASDISACRRAIDDGVNGLLVPPSNPRAQRQGLEALLSDPDLLMRLRTNAQASVQHYSWDDIADQTLLLYEKAMVQSRGRRGVS